MYKQALVINGRNLGDAVIQSRCVRKLIDGGFAEKIVVWTRPECAPAYDGVSRVEVVTSPFPLISKGRFGGAELRIFWKAVRGITKLRPQISLDFFGDKREWLFARLIGWQKHVAISWAPHHPFRRALGAPRRERFPDGSMIPANVISVYESYDLFVRSLIKQPAEAAMPPFSRAPKAGIFHRIGLHPFASQECNRWPDECWSALGRNLIERGAEVWVFGSPADRRRLEQIFEPLRSGVRIWAVSLSAFLIDVGTLDLMIGLDSLGVHAADRAGVPSIVIAGANPKEMWRPPLAVAIGQSGGCPHYPCYKRPVCSAGPERFSCIRSISPTQVLQLLEALEHSTT